MIKLQRVKENPILTPSSQPWDNFLVFNPAVFYFNNKIHLLYRAMGKGDRMSRLGLAESTDGIHFTRKNNPVYYGGGHDEEKLGVEDPRVVKIDDTYYIIYTAVSEDLESEVNPKWAEQIVKKPRVAASTTKDWINFLDYDVILPHLDAKNATLFPKKVNDEYWILFRSGGGATYLANSPYIKFWPEQYPVFDKRPGQWDSARVGIGAQPIETEKGWLLFYHGIDNKNIYRLGIMFLDHDDPRKVIYRSTNPVLEPEKDYEKTGFIPNVVFTCGAIEKDDQYLVYYGACDEVICVATIEKKLVLDLF